MQEVGGRAGISRPGQAIDWRIDHTDFGAYEVVSLRNHRVHMVVPRGPRCTQRCREVVVVIGRAVMAVAVERHFDGVTVVVSLCVVVVLVESQSQDRRTAHGPQEQADHNDGGELTSHN